MPVTYSALPEGNGPADLLYRGLRLLEILAGMEQPASLLDITRKAGLSKASTYRTIRALQEQGFVDHIGREGYRVGSRSVALGALIGPRPDLLKRAMPILIKLASVVTETTTLHIRSGQHRILVIGAEPQTNPHRRKVHVGERSPLTSGASGLAILSFLPEPESARIIQAHVRVRDRETINTEMDVVREDGYALSFSANHVGLNGIGAPVIDPDDGTVLASIVVSGLEPRMPEVVMRKQSLPLRAACADLAGRISTVIGPNSSVRLEPLDVTVRKFVSTDE